MRISKPILGALALPLAALLAAAIVRADGPASGAPPTATATPAPATPTATAAPAAPQEAPPPAPVPRPASTRTAKGTLTILHTNDWHGYALAQTKKATKTRPALVSGGLVATAALIARTRAELGADHVLALDAGDLLTGLPVAAMAEDGVSGATFMRAYSGVGYDAWVIGNHDFDHGRKNAEANIALVAAPCLCANLVKADDGSPALAKTLAYKVFERGGLKVGVMGCTAPDLARLSSAETMAGLKALPLHEALAPIAAKLRPEVDLLVACTHAGVDADKALARTLPSIDVIVGGHSHTRLQKPVVENGVVIVQAGCNGREVGRLDLVVEGGKVASHEGKLIAPEAEGVTANAAMAEPMAKMEKYMADLEADVIGETAQALGRGDYHMEQPMGSFICDALKSAAKCDVGFMNSGGIRSQFDKGPVTRAELLKVLPNDDPLATFEVSGADLERICLHNARAAVTHDHGILQVGGVRYRWKKVGPEDRQDAQILDVKVNGKPLEREKTYVCVSTEFIVTAQAPKYLSVEPKNKKVLEVRLYAAIEQAFKHGPVEAPDRFRIFEERLGGKKPKKPREPKKEEPEGEDAPKGGEPEKKEPAKKEPVPAGAENGEDGAYHGHDEHEGHEE